MKPSTLEWIDKAEGDFATAQTTYRSRKQPNYDAACFHTQQQCAEKYLKARPEEAGLSVPGTHNLFALLKLVQHLEPTWQSMTADLNVLNAFAVAYRYPGISATKLDAQDAIRHCRKIRQTIRQSFGLPV